MPPLVPFFSPNFVMYCLGLASYVEPIFADDGEVPSLTVTAVVPALNEEENISRTLEGLLHQTRALSRIIVVDDGSTDGTGEVARGFPGVRVLRNPRRMGKAESINRALGHVFTDLVLVVDADTTLEDGFVDKALRAFSDGDVVAAGGFVVPSRESKNRLIRDGRVVEYFYAQSTLKRGQNLFNGQFVVSGCCAVFRSSVLKEVGFPGETITEDLDLTWSLERRGYRTTVVEGYAYTLEPRGLRQYLNQIRRWYMGFFQSLLKHGTGVLENGPLSLTVAMILMESLFFTFFWVALMGVALLLPLVNGELGALRWLVPTVVSVDLVTVLFPAVFKAYGAGVHREFLTGLPVYYFLRVVNAFTWWVTLLEWLFGLGTAWRKVN